jgi:hypothetical protein
MTSETTEEIPLAKLVTAYINMRAAIQEKEEQYKTELAAMQSEFNTLSARLLELCNAQNADSIKTPEGTVSRRVQSRYWTSDWDSMYSFITTHDAAYVLEKRIHNSNMRQFLDEYPNLHPAGLQVENKYVIQVRKPTAR